ncbi:2-dehydro-3-deoxygalactonokinase [Azotobacter chroococcum]|uniref:2-keto-3-deoxygalactonate kinase n=1 Tax=Azotobacter chroococcum TaxID=353 RepID=A0A4R1PTI6_9GAMM|nr:2-dehydro-3-deoxygalactonokinase [Azotobacter chroococcum]TBV93455.1 2-dehydro-3-deoxygalactonokinase [Azotobacter chroococcum]TCL33329.1 2-keto-3-deoxygalactonate kinase [Azotobacter chroococcum]
MSDSEIPRLIGLDWGTSSLRAYLLGEGGRVLDRRAEPWGIQHVPDGDFARAFAALTGDWRARWPGLPALAAGMIGSAQGWQEVPYVECPADAARLVGGLRRIDSGDGGYLHLVPGVLDAGALPNVLRGEETQVFGALQLAPELSAKALLVLPGTHSKWAAVEDSAIRHFSTYMTGELFAVLRDHSILGRPARAQGSRPAPDAFARGLELAREGAVAGRLFSARSLVLTGRLAAEESLDYLSGLLIGEELRCALASLDGACPPLVLIGDGALCRRYREALRQFGVEDVRLLEESGSAGLWRIAEAAGLLATPAIPTWSTDYV